MIKVLEYEGMTVTFDFGDHNVLVTEEYKAGKYGYNGEPSTKIMTEQEAEREIGKLIRLGYIGMN